MTAEEWIDSNADKASTRFTDDGITLWEESEVCEMMQKYALHIAEQAVKDEDEFWLGDSSGLINRTCENILLLIKKLTEQ